MSKKTLIITGGHVDLVFAKQFIQEHQFDLIICADKGLMAAERLLLIPNIIVGDFDSVDPKVLEPYKKDSNIIIRSFQPEKDNTDTEIAIDVAIELLSTEVVILGATGSRLDHTIANIHLLLKLLVRNISAFILNESNKLYLVDKETEIHKKETYGEYISLIPITNEVLDVTLTGFKYPLFKHKLLKEESLGISNEIVDEKANISFTCGTLLIVESHD